jgi:precorrin-6B methylase 1
VTALGRGRAPGIRRGRGSLVIVGTGIRAVRHTTAEARDEISRADKLFYLVADAVSEEWIKTLNPTAESLASCYARGKSRMIAYRRMISKMLAPVHVGSRVCAAFYGHPGVFVYPSHEAIRLARKEGYEAQMLPGISAEDCLFADLGIDPSRSGCQSFEATDFLIFRRKFDPSSSLLLWQAGIVGSMIYRPRGVKSGLHALARYLAGFYGGQHEVVLYEASPLPLFNPVIRSTTISKLPTAGVDGAMTLFIPPKPGRPDPDGLRQLRLSRAELKIVPPCWDPER